MLRDCLKREINRYLFKIGLYINVMGEDMGSSRRRITYTKPKQLPLFEEEDDGHLIQYEMAE